MNDMKVFLGTYCIFFVEQSFVEFHVFNLLSKSSNFCLASCLQLEYKPYSRSQHKRDKAAILAKYSY
jgi:hypothetical protein